VEDVIPKLVERRQKLYAETEAVEAWRRWRIDVECWRVIIPG
jgi:hypothetical protein